MATHTQWAHEGSLTRTTHMPTDNADARATFSGARDECLRSWRANPCVVLAEFKLLFLSEHFPQLPLMCSKGCQRKLTQAAPSEPKSCPKSKRLGGGGGRSKGKGHEGESRQHYSGSAEVPPPKLPPKEIRARRSFSTD